MKKITSLMLAIALIFSLNVTAYAAEPEAVSTEPDEYGCVFLTEEQTQAFLESRNSAAAVLEEELLNDEQQGDEQDEESLLRASSLSPGYVSTGIAEIFASPLFWERETKRLFYYPEVGVQQSWSTTYTSTSLRLTSDQAQAVYDYAFQWLQGHGTPGYGYAIVGWYIETLVQLRAISPSKPQYIEYRAAEPNFGAGTDYLRENVTQSICSYRISAACEFPTNANNTSYYHIGGVEGTFWYKAENGKVFGIPFSAGLALNVQS